MQMVNLGSGKWIFLKEMAITPNEAGKIIQSKPITPLYEINPLGGCDVDRYVDLCKRCCQFSRTAPDTYVANFNLHFLHPNLRLPLMRKLSDALPWQLRLQHVSHHAVELLLYGICFTKGRWSCSKASSWANTEQHWWQRRSPLVLLDLHDALKTPVLRLKPIRNGWRSWP